MSARREEEMPQIASIIDRHQQVEPANPCDSTEGGGQSHKKVQSPLLPGEAQHERQLSSLTAADCIFSLFAAIII
jgi:hypothetical protein